MNIVVTARWSRGFLLVSFNAGSPASSSELGRHIDPRMLKVYSCLAYFVCEASLQHIDSIPVQRHDSPKNIQLVHWQSLFADPSHSDLLNGISRRLFNNSREHHHMPVSYDTSKSACCHAIWTLQYPLGRQLRHTFAIDLEDVEQYTRMHQSW